MQSFIGKTSIDCQKKTYQFWFQIVFTSYILAFSFFAQSVVEHEKLTIWGCFWQFSPAPPRSHKHTMGIIPSNILDMCIKRQLTELLRATSALDQQYDFS